MTGARASMVSMPLPVSISLLLSMPLLLSSCAATGTVVRSGADPGAAVAAATARENVAKAQASTESLPKPVPLVMMGSLTYRARIALPPQAEALVELREWSTPEARDSGRVVAEQRIPLRGRQVPVPFSVYVERGTLLAAGRHELRGGIVVDGRPAWVSPPVRIDITTDRVDAGELVMQPYQAEPFAQPSATAPR